jgi:homoserine acetyltransferase
MGTAMLPADPTAAARAAFIAPETRWWDPPDEVRLEMGGTLRGVRIAYRAWGRLEPDGGNAVIVCHALTGSADVDRWWAQMFGPAQALDPDRDFILCANILGSCYGTTGPASTNRCASAACRLRCSDRRIDADRAGESVREPEPDADDPDAWRHQF